MGKPRIISSEPCEYRDVSCDWNGYQIWFKEEVLYTQAIEDLDMLVYLIKTAYVGYEDAVKQGLQSDQIIELFKKTYSEKEIIKVSDLSQFICDFFSPYIQDCHFSVESKNFKKSLVTQYRVLYSNVFVKKENDFFVINKSDNIEILVGKKLECDSENLFLYPSEDEDLYRLGTYATLDENEKKIYVISSGNKIEISCNISNNYLWTNNLTTYKEIETEDSIYVYIPTLMDLEIKDKRKTILDENYAKLKSISKRYPRKKNIILDLRVNGGGNSNYFSKFIANLFFMEKKCDEKTSYKNIGKEWKIIGYNGDKINLISPATQQAEFWLSKNIFSQERNFVKEMRNRKRILNNRNLRITYNDQKIVKPKSRIPKYKGKLIILSGKNTCSSSELAIFEAKSLFSKTNQFFQIGENTAGCYAYGNVWCYQLNNSGIAIHLPTFKSPFSNTCPEGLGFIPNYWSTNEDILKTLEIITKDKDISEKLKDINNIL